MTKLNDKAKKTYCPLAWTHSFVNQDGSYQVCCSSEEFDNFIRDEKGEKIFIDSEGQNHQTVMNSKFMKDLRVQMLNGEWPELCKRCEMTEEFGGHSRRNVEIKNYQNYEQEFLSSTATDGALKKIDIKSADYRLGNLCNLQCRMCNPRSTKLWISEWNEMKPDREIFSDEVMESYQNYNWIDDPILVKDFEDKAPTLEHIHFAGGEPLIVPQMSQILKKCIESGNAKNITITYNTNMTRLPKKVLELWKEFKAVKLLVSIDAVGELNHYIRYPAKWEHIDKNLKFIDEHHEEYNIQECMISSTVQILNVLRLEEMFDYLEQFKFIVPVPNLINLHIPTYFKTTTLPKELKLVASEKLLNLKTKYENNIPEWFRYLTDNIPQIVNFMNSYDGFENNDFEEFIKYQTMYDNKKDLKLTDFYPEFTSLIKKSKDD